MREVLDAIDELKEEIKEVKGAVCQMDIYIRENVKPIVEEKKNWIWLRGKAKSIAKGTMLTSGFIAAISAIAHYVKLP